jgi:hypothetical protein
MYDPKDLKTQTNVELVGVHNSLNPDKLLSNWKGKKSDLIDRIGVLVKAIKAKTQVKTKIPKLTQTIKSRAIDLLCQITHYENKTEKSGDENYVNMDHPEARSVGIPYSEILQQIHDDFEGCKTTTECLRWYAVKIRVGEHGYEDLRMPQRRPRAKVKPKIQDA